MRFIDPTGHVRNEPPIDSHLPEIDPTGTSFDGLSGKKGNLELRPEDIAANEPVQPDTTLPVATLDPEQLEVYGWESNWWKKIKSYIGF